MADMVSADAYKGALRKIEEQRKALLFLNAVGGNKAIRRAFKRIDKLHGLLRHSCEENVKREEECMMYRQMLNDAAEDYKRLAIAFSAYVADNLMETSSDSVH